MYVTLCIWQFMCVHLDTNLWFVMHIGTLYVLTLLSIHLHHNIIFYLWVRICGFSDAYIITLYQMHSTVTPVWVILTPQWYGVCLHVFECKGMRIYIIMLYLTLRTDAPTEWLICHCDMSWCQYLLIADALLP